MLAAVLNDIFQSLANILTQNKLEGPNYVDWKRNLDILQTAEEYKFVLSEVCLEKPGEGATQDQIKAHQKWVKADEMARCYILASMSNVLQHQHQKMDTTYDILENLKEMFGDQTSAVRQNALREILTSKMEEGTQVRTHVLKMMSLLNDMEVLGAEVDKATQIEMVLNTLPPSFQQFRLNYNMNKMDFTMSKLLNELVAAETIIKQGATPVVLNIERASSSVQKKGKCFHCKQPGHWKLQCPTWLAKKKQDSGATNHVCNSLQGFQETRQLSKGEVNIFLGDGTEVAVLAVGNIALNFKNNRILSLKNVLISLLVKDGPLSSLKVEALPTCESCLEGKMTNRPFPLKGNRANDVLELIHSDLCGPMSVQARVAETEKRHGKYIKTLRSDHGGEYISREFITFLSEQGITSQLSAPDLPISFWGHVIETAAYILNLVPSKSVFKTPTELWTGPPIHVPFEEHIDEVQDVVPPVINLPALQPQQDEGVAEQPVVLRRSGRTRRPPVRYTLLGEAFDRIPEEVNTEPVCYDDALQDKDADKWLVAMKSEMESMYSNQVWELVEPPKGVKPIGSYFDYEIWQMDVKTAFLNGSLDECIYMKQLEDDQDFGFDQCHDVSCVYKKWNVLGEAAHILGIKLMRNRKKRMIGLSQALYIDTILNRFNMQGSKKGFLPFRHGIVLSKDQSPKTPEEIESMKAVPYASAVGSLMYAMLCTRPDIYFAVGMVSRFQSNPGREHWTAVKHIIKYLKRTRDYMLVFQSENLVPIGYTDSDFQSDQDSRKSTSGNVFVLGGGAISWRSIKQTCVADFTMEAEYVAASEAAKEAVWLRNFLLDLGVVPSVQSPITLYCDNSGAVANSKEPRSHKRAKHIKRKYHLIRDIVQRGDVVVMKIASENNLADPFTKSLSSTTFERHVEGMGVKVADAWL
ncbi:Retrovirus-related Pol polyprotein from transposon TNT 1-94 [Vitis vinifera]|uniref:Retrovirus-related Pol polyprotein from transposon TNT 1-94 n=1 Tax=Vitis vinifera TaxID=29760 RepID=A0A438DMX0_VITVI|nr:Retrovirus-related Pol polyprotein from transposon TNT 1-94 [Vitis vinifera]